MRRFTLYAFIILVLIGVVILGAGYTLAQGGDFIPASPAFPFQKFAEQQMLNLLQDTYLRADYAFQLLARRTQVLADLVGSPAEMSAVDELNQALDQAIQTIGQAPQEGLAGLKTRLAMLLLDTKTVIGKLAINPASGPEPYAALQAKVLALEKMVGSFAESEAALASAVEANLLVNPLPTQPASQSQQNQPRV